jgi:sugar phosphate isomerase/epimerase
VEDTVRLARRVDHPSLGVTFNLCHWMMTDGTELEARLDAAMPHLLMVTLNGADEGAKDWAHLIQPLDAGTFNVGHLLRLLRHKGYTGPFGLQHFGIGGDARANLQRSMTAWRRLQAEGHGTTDGAADPK